jgi:predicted Zn finger-like uncharacterized protein
MKFSCDRCQTRYSIGDDKVRGKVLKIRCKTCGNIVVVREQLPTVQGEASGYAVPQMASAGTGSVPFTGGTGPLLAAASPPPPSQTRDIEWFIAIKGKQHGPASADDVARLYRDGLITERSYLWHEGLSAWTRLKELPAFASLVAEGPAPVRRPPPPPPEGAEVVDFEAARAQRQQQQGREQPAPVMNDPFAVVAPGPNGQHEAPRDSTRVFIMQAGLHNRGTKHKMYAGIAAAAAVALVALVVIDYQLDILGLRQVVDAVAEKTGIKETPPEDTGPGWDDVDADPTLKCRLMPDPAACIQEAKARAKVVRTGRKKPTSAGAAVSDDDLKSAFGSGAAGGTTPAIGAVAAVGGDGFVSVGTGTPSKEDIDRMLKGGKGGPTGPKARIELPATIGTSIDAENAKKVVQDGQGGIQLCVDSAMKMGEDIPGKVIFTLTIGKKGSVERATANNAVVGASSLGGCLASTMKKWKFAPPQEPTDLDIPLILR